MTWRSLVASIRRGEWLAVAAVAAASMVLAAWPPLVGWANGLRRGLEWTGLGLFSPGDFGVYLSYISQAEHGSPWLPNLFSVAASGPTLRPFWWLVGQVAGWLEVGPVAGFYLLRVLLVPVLTVSAYLAVAAFVDRRGERLAAFCLLMFGSGWGAFYAWLSPSAGGGLDWPIDLWVAESNLFASLLHSPHFVASWSLLLLTGLLLVLGFRSGRWTCHALAGLSALILFFFHPFHAPTLYSLGAVGFFAFGGGGQSWLRRGLRLLPFYVLSAPAIVFQYLHLTGDAASREMLSANLTSTPGWPWLLIGLGLPVLLLPFGWRLMERESPRRASFLLGWILVQIVLIYLPFSFQRRLLEGLQFPLVVLAAPAVVAGLKLLQARSFGRRAVAAVMMLALLSALSSSAYVWLSSLQVARGQTRVQAFFSSEQSMSLEWIRRRTSSEASFVSAGSNGYLIAGWAGRRVLFGHWVNSGDVFSREGEVREFLTDFDDPRRVDFMRLHGLTHVYLGPTERSLLDSGLDRPFFRRAYAGGGIEIYELQP